MITPLRTPLSFGAQLHHQYLVECFDCFGMLKWIEEFHNLVTTAGMNKYLDATLKTGLAAPAWYVSLYKAATTGPDAADTLATHGGWTEGVPTTDWTGNRIAYNLSGATIAAGSVSNAANKAVFPILGTLTILGALLADAATGTSGTLLGVGTFVSGSRSVISGDSLSVTITCSLS